MRVAYIRIMATERIIAYLPPRLAEHVKVSARRKQISRSRYIEKLVEMDESSPKITREDILQALKEADDPACRTTFSSKEEFLAHLHEHAQKVLDN